MYCVPMVSAAMTDSAASRDGGFSTRAVVVWLVIVVLALGYGIGGYGLIEPDVGRNAEVAREIAVTNN